MNKRKNALVLALVGLSTSGLTTTLSAGEELAADLQTFESYLDVGYDQKYRPQFHFTSRKNPLNARSKNVKGTNKPTAKTMPGIA